MKVSGAKQVHYESGPNMTPLVDVVMVILIFLMLAGSFGSGEKYMVTSAQLQGKGTSSAPPPKDWVPPVQLDIQINREGGVRVPWQPTAITDVKKLTEALAGQLKTLTEQHQKSAKEIELVLRPDGGVEWERLAPIYDAALQAKFEKVGFAPAR